MRAGTNIVNVIFVNVRKFDDGNFQFDNNGGGCIWVTDAGGGGDAGL